MEEHLPLDSSLNAVYRSGGLICGGILLVFGVVGFLAGPEFFSVDGEKVLGLYSNGLLALISVAFGVVLIGAAAAGRNVAAIINTWVGSVLLASGLINLALIRTDANFLAFRMSNIIFSFVVGLVLLICGLYGRVSVGHPTGARSSAPAP